MQLLLRLRDALVHMGHHVIIGTTGYDVLLADVVLLTNLMIYQKDIVEMLLHNKIPYFVLCFHEDITQYYLPSNGLANYVKKCIEGVPDYSIDRLYENPHAVYYEEVAKLQFCAKSALFAKDSFSAHMTSTYASSETISYFSDFFPRGYYFIFDASEWCTIQDYLVHSGPENIQYVLPFHIAALERKVEQFLSVEPKKVYVSEPCLKRSMLDYAQGIVDLIE